MSITKTVTTQAELDAAIASTDKTSIKIDAPPTSRIKITNTAGKQVDVGGSSKVDISGEASVGYVSGEASVGYVYDEASVGSVSGKASVGYVYDEASVGYVYDEASVGYVYDEASVGSVSGKASVGYVYDEASVGYVYDEASVGSVSGKASVGYVYGKASVGYVYGKASVGQAGGYAVVRLHDHATLENAGPRVAVYKHDSTVTIGGNPVIIDVTGDDLTDPATWCDVQGVRTDNDGTVLLYKAVSAGLKSERGFHYPIGETVTDPAWNPGDFCGGGLHVCPSPGQSKAYYSRAERFVVIRASLDDLCPITEQGVAKAKIRTGLVVGEVDGLGRPVVAAVVSA